MNGYRRLTQVDRIRIKDFLILGLSQTQIADKLKVHKSTISREIKRNSGLKGYRFKQAQRTAEQRQAFRSNLRKWTATLEKKVRVLLKRKWSPEQISSRLKLERKESISHQRIYEFIEEDRLSGVDLWKNLRYSRKLRRKRSRSKDHRGQIKQARSIEERPESVKSRSYFGHWERDTMHGAEKKGGLLVCVERKYRYVKLTKLLRRTAEKTAKATIKLLRDFPVRTITNDRGHEFGHHNQVAHQLNTQVFFCHPYSSCERGTNENRIGVIRQYFPKKTPLLDVTWYQLRKVEKEINNRPMKCLGWRTPSEVFLKQKQRLII